MRRVLHFLAGTLALLAVTVPASSVEAQSLRDRIAELFIFGPGNVPLFLGGSGPLEIFRVVSRAGPLVPVARQR
jgi:hypothetical protein